MTGAAGSQNTGPQRAWQRMLSGRRLDLLNPSPADIEIEDIAHGLSRVARWNGQTHGKHSFSVAQHSLLVEEIACALQPNLPADQRLAALLHDAAEYVIGDLISPFKAVVGAPYRGVEDRIFRAIHLRFGLPVAMSEACARLIKSADQIAAYREAVELAGFTRHEADLYFRRPPGWPQTATPPLAAWPTDVAERAFLERFEVLSKNVSNHASRE